MSRIYDLRSYIEVLEEARQLTHIRKPVQLTHELANVAATLARQGQGPVIFEKPVREADTLPWQVFANAVVSPSSAALSLQCSTGEVPTQMGKALELGNGIQPQVVDEVPAWKKNVISGDQINLYQLPSPRTENTTADLSSPAESPSAPTRFPGAATSRTTECRFSVRIRLDSTSTSGGT